VLDHEDKSTNAKREVLFLRETETERKQGVVQGQRSEMGGKPQPSMKSSPRQAKLISRVPYRKLVDGRKE